MKQRSPAFVHRVFKLHVVRRTSSGAGLRTERWQRRLGREICVVRGKRRFRAWAIRHYMGKDGLGRCPIGFMLVGSPNNRVYYEVLPIIMRGRPSVCFVAWPRLA
jgi:hypothetical protein